MRALSVPIEHSYFKDINYIVLNCSLENIGQKHVL
jgi:hypothetical protein